MEKLSKGQAYQARIGLEAASTKTLIVTGGGYGDGAMQAFSPTTLLMKLGKEVTAQAVRSAQSGDKQAALAWLDECRLLSRRVSGTPAPNLDALNTARFLDAIADNAEAQIYTVLGEGSKVVEARVRREHMNRFWHEKMLEPVAQFMHARREDEYQAGKAGLKSTPQLERKEAQIAEQLLHSYIAARVQAQTEGRIAEQSHRLLQSLPIG